jgi:hypothetical protein
MISALPICNAARGARAEGVHWKLIRGSILRIHAHVPAISCDSLLAFNLPIETPTIGHRCSILLSMKLSYLKVDYASS